MLGESARSRLGRALAAAGLEDDAETLTIVRLGQSGDLVARSHAGLFIKVALAPASARRRLEREAEVLAWLAPLAPTAGLVWAGPFEDGHVLVTTALSGVPASDVSRGEARRALVSVIGALADLHAIPSGDCPFDARLARRLDEAAGMVAAGLVDASDFDLDRQGLSPVQVLERARHCAPDAEDLVVAHGDASLPNFLCENGRCTGMIDLGRLGVADRHQDLAIFLRSAAHNHRRVDARALLAEHYPAWEPDEAKLSYYRLLDELF